MEDDEKPELVLVDVPLVLERADAPVDDRKDTIIAYNKCRDTIESFGKSIRIIYILLIKMELKSYQ